MKFLRLLFVPFALFCVAYVRLSKRKIRFGIFMADRIGHLAGNSEVYLCERDAGQHEGYTDLWTAFSEPANKQLYAMLKRSMTIGGWLLRMVVVCNRLFAGWEKHEIKQPDQDRDPQNLFEKHPAHHCFTPAELQRAYHGLKALGIPYGAKWVCLIVRDGAYLPGLTYHNFRDADVDTYTEACLALAERGYYVIRMGAKVAKPMAFTSPKIIDYASNGTYSDFMSIYLGAKCEFCISTGCGFDAIPYIFRRPICYTNYVPIEYLFTFAQGSLAIWKHHEKDGKRMTLSEIYASGAGQFMRAEEFEDAGITLVDNTPQEICDVVMEMADKFTVPGFISGGHTGTELLAQDAFWRTFPRSISQYTNRPLHGEICMRIGAEFLKAYSDPECTCGEQIYDLCKLHDYADTRTA